MKTLGYFLSSIVLVGVLFTVGCKPEPTKTSEEDQRKIDMSVTWATSSVTLDGADVTSDFSAFELTVLDNFNYNTTSVTRTPQPWPATGSFVFGTKTDQTVDINKVIRDDGLVITVGMGADAKTMTLSFTFIDGTHTSGRTEAISGDWVFSFTVK